MKKILLSLILPLLFFLVLLSQPALSDTRENIQKKSSLNLTHREMFAMEDFTSLDKAMNSIQREYEDGSWSDEELDDLFSWSLRGHAPELEAVYNKWVEVFPKSYAAHQARGLYFSRLVDRYYKEALEITKIKSWEDIPPAQADKIKHYAALAITDHNTAIKLRKGKPVLAYAKLIMLYAVTGDMKTSRALLEKVNRIAPDNKIARLSYMTLLHSDRFYKGDETLDEMRKLADEAAGFSLEDEHIEIADLFHIRLLKEGKYAELEKRMGDIQRKYEAGKIHDRTLRKYFYDFGLANPDHAEKLNAWIKKYPKSYAARQTRAMYLLSAAWRARGNKYMTETSSQEVEGMEHYLGRAWDDCVEAATLTAKPILSYRTMVSLLQTGGGRQQIYATVERANIVDPKNAIVRMAYMDSLQTRWGGSLELMEEYLEEAKLIGLPETVIMDFEESIIEEKRWLTEQVMKQYENIGQVVTGF
ncbi:MAG: DUF4034 domain-containing protein [Pseudomonadota bacterium]|jgi:hypothetical protein|nr:DUF4034 domain-containing protein [Pseudomonadota bacterium]QKK05698.1 MAG: DUF4034 domain-containing protein [Pseudomonadota bacterium]